MRLTQADAHTPLSESLEAVARKLTRSAWACSVGTSCPMCKQELVKAREAVIGVWNAAHDAADVDRAILETPAAPTETVLAAAQAVAEAWPAISGFAGFPTARRTGDNGSHASEGHTSYVVNRMVDLREALDALSAAVAEMRKVRP